MPVFDKHKLIHHHIPKTSGRAISEWLGNADAHPGHMPVVYFEKQLELWNPKLFEFLPERKSYRSFSIMRSPRERIRSGFEHVKATSSESTCNNGKLKNQYSEAFSGSFNDFLLSKDLLEIIMSKSGTMLYPLTWMFCSDSGNIKNPLVLAPDFVLDFNNLEEDTNFMVEKLKLDVGSKFKFKRTQRETAVLSDAAYKKMRHYWNWDFKIYSFFLENIHIKKVL